MSDRSPRADPRPVLVLQHVGFDGPAALGAWLAARGVPADVRNTEAGAAYPQSLEGYRALAVLGGPMSANDDLPSLRQAERLILQGLRDGIPVAGHCLGGQLMARALGARVAASPAPEIGWVDIEVDDHPAARAWMGVAPVQRVFHWHYEAFELPAGATRLARSAACPNQAFAIGPHLAMQFHVELDAAKLDEWHAQPGDEYRAALGRHASVQPLAAMRAEMAASLPRQGELADRLWSRWLDGPAGHVPGRVPGDGAD
jgi:GMP synthase-like glutamine amidotransferase